MPDLGDLELLRLYLADPLGGLNGGELFKDHELERFLSDASDVAGAAATGWRIKASRVAEWYNVSLDGSELSRGQVYRHCIDQADHFSGISSGVITSVKMSTDYQSNTEESEFAS